MHHPAAALSIGAYLGKLPDFIEPSLGNPNHRQFFHSVLVLGLLGTGVYKLYRWDPQDNIEKVVRGILLMGGAAYLESFALTPSKFSPIIITLLQLTWKAQTS